MSFRGITFHLPPVGNPKELKFMNPVIQAVLEQGFANVSQNYAQAAARHASDSSQISTDAARQYMLTQQLVGAKAAGQLDRSAISHEILQSRSAAGQPQLDSAQVK